MGCPDGRCRRHHRPHDRSCSAGADATSVSEVRQVGRVAVDRPKRQEDLARRRHETREDVHRARRPIARTPTRRAVGRPPGRRGRTASFDPVRQRDDARSTGARRGRRRVGGGEDSPTGVAERESAPARIRPGERPDEQESRVVPGAAHRAVHRIVPAAGAGSTAGDGGSTTRGASRGAEDRPRSARRARSAPRCAALTALRGGSRFRPGSCGLPSSIDTRRGRASGVLDAPEV